MLFERDQCRYIKHSELTPSERFEVCNYDGTILRSNEISLPKKNMLDLLLYKTYFIGQ